LPPEQNPAIYAGVDLAARPMAVKKVHEKIKTGRGFAAM
jgi:hypothetical protein